ncbi:MAG: hypothetical protein ACOC44_07640 [Promethearchaeia archaeon]
MPESKEDKVLVRRDTLSLRRKYGRTKRVDVIERDAFVPPGMEDEIKEYVTSKNKVVTATDVAVKFDIRVSTIKELLRRYESEGLIEVVDPSLTMKIYKPTS